MLVKVGLVFGLLFVTLRVVGKLHNSGPKLGARKDGAVLQVLGRQSLGRNADVTVVALGDRTLVLGVTEHNVSVVTELATTVTDAPILELPARTQASSSVPTWRDLLESLRERTVRH
jgi:flagellar protein FliO/FliZ